MRTIFFKSVLVGSVAISSILPAGGAQPAVRFSSYLGGVSSDIPTAVTTGSDGSIFVAGFGGSNLPNVQTLNGNGGAFVAKISADGSALIFATVIGDLYPRAIKVDQAGYIYLAGHTLYGGLPVTNAIQPTKSGDSDAVVLKLDPTGKNVIFATYFGGTGDEAALSIALDGNGKIWLGGFTSSTDFHVTNGPVQLALAGRIDGFLARFSNDGTVLEYATYFGGEDGSTVVSGVAIDSLNRPVVVGGTASPNLQRLNAKQDSLAGPSDAFVTKFDSSGQSLVFSTYLGGSSVDSGAAVALDSTGNIYVQGYTRSTDFPTNNPAQASLGGDEDVFLAKLKPDGSDFIFSTYFGGVTGEANRGDGNRYAGVQIDSPGLSVTPSGRSFVSGYTGGGLEPILVNPIKAATEQSVASTFAVLYESDGSIAFSTYLGGKGYNAGGPSAASPDGGFVVIGATGRAVLQPDVPVTPGVFQTEISRLYEEGYVIKLDTDPPPLPNDNFENAVEINSHRITLLAQTGAATKQLGELDHNGNAGGKSVWYRWTAPGNGRIVLSTDGSSYPTEVGLYNGSSLATLTPKTVVFTTPLQIKAPVVANEVLQIAVDGKDGASGTLVLSVIYSAPPNDDFADRAPLVGETASTTGSLVDATSELGSTTVQSVWWKWTAPADGFYTIDTHGSDFDTALVVYTGSDITSLNLVSYNDNSTNLTSRAVLHADAGVEYQILVYGDSDESGVIQLHVNPASRPANDDFANRTILTNRNENVVGNDFDTTADPGEQALQGVAKASPGSGHVIWWEWIAPIDGAASITTSNSFPLRDPSVEAITGLFVFAGDEFPTNSTDFVVGFNGLHTASVYLTEIHALVHYQIGVDVVDYEQPAQIGLQIRAIAPPRVIAGTSTVDGGNFTARVEGIEGHNYRVTWTTNLRDWNLLSEHPAITGEFTFTSPVVGDYRFYRIEEY